MSKNSIDPAIFRAYDIRGIYPESLAESDAYLIGQALALLLQKKILLAQNSSANADSFDPNPSNRYFQNDKCLQKLDYPSKQNYPSKIVVARDSRLSSPQLHQALVAGILDAGTDVIDIGEATTPMLYFATLYWVIGSGVMITGSHNPANYNGFKITLADEPLANESIQAIYQTILDEELPKISTTKGCLQYRTVDEDYLDAITQDIQLSCSLRVAIDAGNGIAGPIAQALLKRFGCHLIDLYCEPDGNFPHHHPDPSKPENLKDLIQAVKMHQADIGLAFDGDGDRLGVITNEGELIFPDHLLMLFAKNLLQARPGSHMIFDVKCTNLLAQQIEIWGGKAEYYKTGHSLIKKYMKKTGALLAGEMSGHIFFADRWYGFDDALYSAARLLEILANAKQSEQKQSISQLLAPFPKLIGTPEINIPVDEEEKFMLIEQLASDSILNEMGETIKIDGIRVNTPQSWGLVRASNTTPMLVLRFEAIHEQALAQIRQVFKDALLRAKSDLVIPF